ncbi:MAG: transketolase [Planctomycetes bacterium]|nr:transketolase [Planctomycetota bacterium]MBU4400584.1 transketolase [Planctomycetota bacterium]MCG2682035.1 transketolase [Planctomycetales bacterium]
MPDKSIEQLAIDTIRTLSMDAVQAAGSGHPGTPMALAPAAYVLFNEVLRYDPDQPAWPNRDRFVLSCGHASALLYAALHLAGVKQLDDDGRPTGEPAVSLDDLRRFRQLHGRCPGHPEFGHTSGVETTTGPLGQGIGNSVGMAIASRWLAARYNRPDFDLFDFNVYALCSDGDLMEGVGGEAASLAGHLKLSNLCWIYDDNHITIEGDTRLSFSEHVAARFAGYGWNVVRVSDINSLNSLRNAIRSFRESRPASEDSPPTARAHSLQRVTLDDLCEQCTPGRPTLIIARSVIGFGSPNKAGSHDAHGAPLGDEEIRLTKTAYGWPENEKFLVPDEVRKHFATGIGERGKKLYADWTAKFDQYKAEYPEQAAELERIGRRDLPDGWDADIQPFPADAKGMAGRASSGKVLNQIAPRVPWLLGGSADLAPSNNSLLKFEGAGDFEPDNYAGRNFHFGIREHAMGTVCNGMALCGLRAYGATFFVFSDYMRPSIRLAALMGLPVFYIFTHDSIGVGEDGPTHQPVEHLAALRAIPNLLVFRPADANEVAEAYKVVLPLKDQPAALVLTRQNLPTLDRAKYAPADGLHRGGYVLADSPDGRPEVILIGTGSEVSLCAAVYEKLLADGVQARVVSMPCWELFDVQPAEYREAVLPPEVTRRVAVELGVRQGWEKYIGPSGTFIGMSTFGASAPACTLLEHFGITVENIVSAVNQA